MSAPTHLKLGTLVLEPVSGLWGTVDDARSIDDAEGHTREVRVKLDGATEQRVHVWYPLASIRTCGPYAVVMPVPHLGVSREELEEVREFREMERSFAFEHCASVLDSHCMHYSVADHIGVWLNLLSAEIDVTDEVKYLQQRGLLDIHSSLPGVVSVRDESEGLALTEGRVA